ncbi:MAG: ShlB/FhaC/HecB family hemolysin secretion/activation protein, partial [Gemmatimonadaceae bacterium]
KSEISEVTIEYSLHSGRFWLPRSRSMKGFTQISAVRLPVTIEHTYRYESVNSGDALPPITLNTGTMYDRIVTPDSLKGVAADKWRDSVRKTNRIARDALRDSLDKGPCDASGTRTLARTRYDGQLAIATTFPCDVSKLVTSAEFTGSIYDANEEEFGAADRQALVAHALSLAAQAPFSLLAMSPVRLQYGVSMTRFNRVEGLSTGLLAEQQLGGGYAVSALARIGAADREPNVEVAVSRTNLSRSFTLTGYNRLVSANDWGRPLSFSASVSALLFGRDEGFYYRASGADVAFRTETGLGLDWRLFAERERTARQETDFSLGAGLGPNIEALRVNTAGASVRMVSSLGLDPRGFRLFSDARLEAAGGDFHYGRATLDLTLSHGLGEDYSAGVTLAAGTSAGTLPPQRRWFLGGTETIRGQSADTTQSGNAFWFTRSEIGKDFRAYRVSLFGDLGWVGDRSTLSQVGRPMSGAGVGFSFMDGLLRMDVARGIYPRRQTRVDLSLGARW